MYLKKLALTNFKNYEQNELEFSPRINCFVGNNGVGKTNILDAIHYLSLTKSFFNKKLEPFRYSNFEIDDNGYALFRPTSIKTNNIELINKEGKIKPFYEM